ncbi:hypothetical protein [Terrisporobacter glycolicus]|uniref:hypothetical protein n=1 Tax=Terrisporobacter glycolicus TaxID=36841 RepID=UPI000377642F|nr:hypothetical protein [Terrisporobacter glycolicus]
MAVIKIKTKKIQGIIESIRYDELHHNQITGMKIHPEEETFIPLASFKGGVADAMMG